MIHPGQINAVQKAFSPSARQLDWARELISTFEEHQKLGKVCEERVQKSFNAEILFNDTVYPEHIPETDINAGQFFFGQRKMTANIVTYAVEQSCIINFVVNENCKPAEFTGD